MSSEQDTEQDSEPTLESVDDLGGRPSLYRDDFPEQVWRLARLGQPLTERQLAKFFGVHGSTIRRWKAQKPEFCHAVERGRLISDCQVVEALFLNAIGYSYVEEQAFKLKSVTYGDNGKKLREEERVGRCQSKILNTWSGHRTAQIDPEKCSKINGHEIRF